MALKNHPIVSIVIFLGVAGGLHALLNVPWVQTQILDPYTHAVTAASARLLQIFKSDVTRSGQLLYDSFFSVKVLNVCNGTDLLILFTAAVLAFPAPWKARGLGLLVGLPLLAIINLVRVMGLFLTGRYLSNLFEVSHLFIWQAVLIAVTAGLFAIYLRWALGSSRASA